MDTDKKRVRRNHSPALKAQVLAECDAPGASVAKVAMAHGINANIVHGWRKLARASLKAIVPAASFVPVTLKSSAASPSAPVAARGAQLPNLASIDIELRRGALSVRIAWPLSASSEMSAWLRDVLR